jgi:hypothetical protein
MKPTKIEVTDKGAKAPKSRASSKEAQRQAARDQGLVRFCPSDVWVTPAKLEKLKLRYAQILAEVIGSED